ncbi:MULTISPECIES: SulP family inorganic anion transporter [unclassified Beijerinckia]|uniref:SulP family inorganic anion transporter n=1 Tax=unclassified Beijerinckia TaxID=2638183 RepID=UPI00089482CE|nr:MULTISPECIES: SulP family inorganic anion transporter [unclassified Beijerinckia]MDH7797210.1 SulP family sulfate permease [Beijerinckia sp. GAS462]SEC76432.1 high affinity sulphate transporter 1 [Beijerinckia sp. 28-YEA-48]
MRFPLLKGILPLDRAQALRDIVAGATLAAMSIPQVLGYARIAGMPAVNGLYTVLWPTVAFAILGASRHLVVAADSATATILASRLTAMAPIGSAQYVALAGMVALLTAGLLLLARIFKLGFLADFLSRTVLVGFLAGVGVQVAIAMLGDMLGLRDQPHNTIQQVWLIVQSLGKIHLPTLIISTVVAVGILALKYWIPRVPGPLLAVVLGIAASYLFDFAGRGISVLGQVQGGLPGLHVPLVSWQETLALLPVAGACFVMIIAQSAAAGRAFADRYRERVDADSDILGLAAANAAAAASGTFVVNGSPTQTAAADSAGARSQLAQLAFAAIVVFVLLFLSDWLQYLPHGILAALVFTIAIGLVNVKSLRAILRESPGEFGLAFTTAAAVVLIGVEQGILLAIVLSLLRHVRHSYRPHTTMLVQGRDARWMPARATPGAETAPGLIVFRFGADLFYANDHFFVEEVNALVDCAPHKVHWLVIDASAITDMDYSASRSVADVCTTLLQSGVEVIFARVSQYLRADLERHGIVALLGETRIFATLHEALVVVGVKTPVEPSPET